MSQGQKVSRQLIAAIRAFLKDRFNLSEGKASERETIEYIKQGVAFRGANLWILIFAVMICSIGLQFNSTAVIIGAMLISPLMGPIMGVGLGTGINDFQLIVASMKNLGIAVAISVATSALYFWISPFESNDPSELLQRTAPTLWDVLIAVFGGFAGIVAGSRREKSNAIPGVAIATALMPPLCTAGYGLAVPEGLGIEGGPNGLQVFVGGMYLFFINSVFISVATYTIVRVLRFKTKEFVDPKRESRVKIYIAIFVILTMAPSGYTAYNVVQEARFENNARAFVKKELAFIEGRMFPPKYRFGENGGAIAFTLVGQPLTQYQIDSLEGRFGEYHLVGCKLDVMQQNRDTSTVDLATVQQLNQQLRTGIIEDLYQKNVQELQSMEDTIRMLQRELVRSQQIPLDRVAQEARAINGNLDEISVTKSVITSVDSLRMDTVFIALVKFKRNATRAERALLEQWLKVRTQADTLKFVVE